MKRLKCAVIGAGHFGRFHAQKYAALPDCDLVAVVDQIKERAEAIASQYRAIAVRDYRVLLGEVEAVSVVTPALTQHDICLNFLNAGAHVLAEKPLATSLEQVDGLQAVSKLKNRILQIGFLERFNPAFKDLLSMRDTIIEIHASRLSTRQQRGRDVCVVLDLMIHDIDLVMWLIDAPIESLVVHGSGDSASAKILFANGSVAYLHANRDHLEKRKDMHVVSTGSQFSLNVNHETDLLLEQIRHFVHCIQTQSPSLVSIEVVQRSLQTAFRVSEAFHESKR